MRRRKKLKGRKAVGLFATPCGGSTYTTRVLKEGGLRVGHESLQPDGTVCGFWAFPAEDKPVDAEHRMRRQADPHGGKWDALGVLIRHPLKVAESLPGIGEIHRFRVSWKHEDPVLHALRYWVEAMALAQAHLLTSDYLRRVVVRVDSHYEEDIKNLCSYLQIPFKRPGMGPRSRSKRWDPISWEKWRSLDPDYARWGEEYVRQYNLEEPE